jgi:prepilin-type N-terminal cleavage/methylation domain-containing protein
LNALETNRARAGFTLIETLGVIAIMALLSAAASIMLSGSRHAADLSASIEQVRQADLFSRALASSSNQTTVFSISLASGSLSRRNGNESTVLGNLPADVRIARVRIAGATVDFGSADIPFSPPGRGPSYAVQFASSTGEKQWAVFAGLTGQMSKARDEDVDSILEETAGSQGADAH